MHAQHAITPADGMEIEFRSDLDDKIIEVVAKTGLPHSDGARLAHTSRTRVTAILKHNSHDTSTDLMLLVLGSLGCKRNSNSRNRAEHYGAILSDELGFRSLPVPTRTMLRAPYCDSLTLVRLFRQSLKQRDVATKESSLR